MADKELNMKLVVDASSVKAATAEQKKLADATKQVGTAQKDTVKQFNAAAEAQKRIQAEARKAAVDAEYRRLGGGAGGPGNAGVPSAAGPGGGGGGIGIPSSLKAAFGISGASALARQAGNYLTSNFNNPSALSNPGIIGAAAEGLPVIGGAISLVNSGYKSRELSLASYGEIGAQRGELQRQIAAARAQTGEPLRDMQRQAGNARIQATEARQFANAVASNPGQYITQNRQGVSNEQTGQVKLEAAQAASEANAAGAVAAAENKRMADAAKAAKDATAAREEAQRRQGETEAAIAQKESQLASRKRDQSLGQWAFDGGRGKNDKDQNDIIELKKRQEDQAQAVAGKQADEARKVADLAKQESVAREASVAAQRASFAAAQKQLDVDRNRLQVVNAEKGVLENRARKFAEMSDDEKRQAVEAAKVLKEKQDIQQLTPEQRNLVRDTQLYQDVALKQGGNDASAKEFNSLVGDRQLSDVTAEAQKLAEGIATKNAELNAKFQETMATTMETAVKNMADIVVATFKNMEEQLRSEFANASRIKRNDEAGR